jgi:Ca2+-binding RTX toxin-like protein
LAASEVYDVSRNGTRVRFARDLGNIVMDLGAFERIDTTTLAGVDRFTAGDLSGTGLTALNVALGNDGAPNDVAVAGSENGDRARVTGSTGSATVTGLSGLTLAVTGAEVPGDRLSIALLAGDDALDASGLEADAIALRVDGNDGDDNLVGGKGPDLLRGGNGDDILAGGPGDDTIEGGAGTDTIIP